MKKTQSSSLAPHFQIQFSKSFEYTLYYKNYKINSYILRLIFPPTIYKVKSYK
jgi:hypothetical protein